MVNAKTVSRITLAIAIFLTVAVGSTAVYIAYRVNKQASLENSNAAAAVVEGSCTITSCNQSTSCEYPKIATCHHLDCGGDGSCGCDPPDHAWGQTPNYQQTCCACCGGIGEIDTSCAADLSCGPGFEECYTSVDLQNGTAQEAGCVPQAQCNTSCSGCGNKSVVKLYCKPIPTAGCWDECETDDDCTGDLGCHDDGNGNLVCRSDCGTNEDHTSCSCAPVPGGMEVSGWAYCDSAGNVPDEFEGEQVFLENEQGARIATTTYSANGHYIFSVEEPTDGDSYTIVGPTFDISRYPLFTGPVPTQYTGITDTAYDKNFVYSGCTAPPPGQIQISGWAFCDSEGNVPYEFEGHEVVLKNAAGATIATAEYSANGFYSFEVVEPSVGDSYKVEGPSFTIPQYPSFAGPTPANYPGIGDSIGGRNFVYTGCSAPTEGELSCTGMTLTGEGVTCNGTDCGEVYPGTQLTLSVSGTATPETLNVSYYLYAISPLYDRIDGAYDRGEFPYGSAVNWIVPSNANGEGLILGFVGYVPTPNDGNNSNDSGGAICGGPDDFDHTAYKTNETGYLGCTPGVDDGCECTSTTCYKTITVIEPPACDWLRLYEDTNSNGVYDAGTDLETSQAEADDVIFVLLSGDAGDKDDAGYPKYRYGYILSDGHTGFLAETPTTENPLDVTLSVVSLPDFSEDVDAVIFGGSIVNSDNVECNGYRQLVRLSDGKIIGSCDNGELEECYKPLAIGDTPLGEFTIVKTADPQSVMPGDEVEFSLVITNTGETADYVQRISDTLPEGFTYGDECSATNANGVSHECAPTVDDRSMIFAFPVVGDTALYLEPGEFATIVFTVVTPETAGTYVNVACLVLPSDGCDDVPVYIGTQPPTSVPRTVLVGGLIGGGLVISGAGLYLFFSRDRRRKAFEQRFTD